MKRIVEFLKYRYFFFALSAIMLVVFYSNTYMKGGLNMGIDFVGGMKVIAKFDKEVTEGSLRDVLKVHDPIVQQMGDQQLNEYIITAKITSEEEAKNELNEVKSKLTASYPGVKFLSEENVGPSIGEMMVRTAIKLVIISMLMMTAYLTFRFEFKYSVGAMVALIHDVILSIGFIGLTGIELNTPVVAALLTIFGYSVNDTIVVFDRIRENTQIKSQNTFIEVINKSITQSMSRTLLTSLTTLFSVFALFLLGGDVLRPFATVLLFGIGIGTYSSIFVAAPAVLGWEKLRRKR